MVIAEVTAETGMIVQEITVVVTTTIGTAAAIEIAVEMIIDAQLPGHVPIGGSDGIIVDLIARNATVGEVSDL